MNNMNERDFYTVPEVEKIIQSPRPTVYSWIQRGWLVAYKVGGRTRVKKEELKKFLARQ